MQDDSTLTNILAITGAGLLLLLTGITFLVFRDFITKHIRYFLPIPPISVAAYIYAFNLYQHYDGNLPDGVPAILKEIMLSVVIISVSFAAFVALLVMFINLTRKLF
jgi:hypothetical protein